MRVISSLIKINTKQLKRKQILRNVLLKRSAKIIMRKKRKRKAKMAIKMRRRRKMASKGHLMMKSLIRLIGSISIINRLGIKAVCLAIGEL